MDYFYRTLLLHIFGLILLQNINCDECTNCSLISPFGGPPCIVPTCSGSRTKPLSVSSCQLAMGMSVPGPSDRDDCFPAWINVTKFVQGQNFFATHYGTIGTVEAFTLMGLLAIPQMSDVLCFTATNDCPAQADKRYSTTTTNIILWGQAIINSPKNPYALLKSMNEVRKTHKRAATRVRNVTIANGNLNNEARFNSATLNTNIWNALKADLEAAYTPQQLTWSSCYTNALNSYVPLNQFQYAMTQWSFAGIQTLSRNRAMIPGATDEEIDSFNYCWAILGNLMGIEDQFNIGLQQDLAATSTYYQDILKFYIIPAIYNLNNVSKYFIELTNLRAESVAIPILNITLPAPLPVDAQLMGFLRVALNIPYSNLYSVASPQGILYINGIEFLLSTGGSMQSLVDLGFNTAAATVKNYLGTRDFGLCYNLWISNCQKASNVHYMYQGPDVNPDGTYSNCASYGFPSC